MSLQPAGLGAPNTDDDVDAVIAGCLDANTPRSFFLYAGAGSGKTRSLERALYSVRERYGAKFRNAGRKIAIITYTNAASDEIASRVDKDPLFSISTIHSFCWSQIGSFHEDIRQWLRAMIPLEIAELEAMEA